MCRKLICLRRRGLQESHVSLAEQPVLAFCRTGTRCTTLWALTQADEQDNASILANAEQAGYDLSQLADRLDQRRGQ